MASPLIQQLYRLLGDLPDGLSAPQARALRIMLDGFGERKARAILERLGRDERRIRDAAGVYLASDLHRELHLPGWLIAADNGAQLLAGMSSTPHGDAGNLTLVGMYLITHDALAFWDRILRPDLSGFALLQHEIAEIRCFLELHRQFHLDAFCGRDLLIGYEVVHPVALLVEHYYYQVRASEDGLRYSLRELILGNPMAADPEADWGYVHDLLEHYRFPLDGRQMAIEDLDGVRDWYALHRVQSVTESFAPLIVSGPEVVNPDQFMNRPLP